MNTRTRPATTRKISIQILLTSSLGLQLLVTAYLEYQIHMANATKGNVYYLWIVLLLSILLLTWANLILLVKYIRQIWKHELQPGILWVAPATLIGLIVATMYLSDINFVI